MLFSSPVFFAFFAGYFALYVVLPRRYLLFLIIGGSTIFYAWWRIEYVALPYALAAIAYFGVRWIERAKEPAPRRRRMLLAVAVLFLPLLVFKYFDFIYLSIFGPLLGAHDKIIDLPLPLGISFVTFTLTAFIVDTYRGKFPPRQRPTTVLAYVLFFPHLIAGPILRPIELIPQLDHPRARRFLMPSAAVAIFTLGLVKKLVVADPLAESVDAIYAAAHQSGPAAVLAIYGFAVQIYCDFSGYTDMAIGLAMLLGVRLPNNFRQPYAARSLVEFWRRWHITLSFWLRDYLYIPLGGNRQGPARTTCNILVTMVLGGLWHGANFTFMIWGLMHGVGISFIHMLHRALPRARKVVPNWLALLITFHFVTIGWILFRAPNFAKAMQIVQAPVVGGGWGTAMDFIGGHLFPLGLILVFFLLHRFDDHRRIKLAVRRFRGELIWPAIALGWILAITVSQGSSAKFIYFDF
jgi:alginate O-acetyltransferase complex protein AlgI